MIRPLRDWSGKRVWIVGASTGIGAALAGELASKGARVALSARSRDKLEALAQGAAGSLALPLDLTDTVVVGSYNPLRLHSSLGYLTPNEYAGRVSEA